MHIYWIFSASFDVRKSACPIGGKRLAGNLLCTTSEHGIKCCDRDMRHLTTKIETFTRACHWFVLSIKQQKRDFVRISRLWSCDSRCLFSTASRYIKLSTSFCAKSKSNSRAIEMRTIFLCKCHCNFHLLSWLLLRVRAALLRLSLAQDWRFEAHLNTRFALAHQCMTFIILWPVFGKKKRLNYERNLYNRALTASSKCINWSVGASSQRDFSRRIRLSGAQLWLSVVLGRVKAQ